MKKNSHAIAPKEGAFKTYVLAFAGSILLTLAAFFCVEEKLFAGWTLIAAIVSLGVIQAFVQLIFFLHLGKEGKPRWNMTAFLFMLMVLCILVAGSVWIMFSLNGRLMTPMEVDTYMQHQQGL